LVKLYTKGIICRVDIKNEIMKRQIVKIGLVALVTVFSTSCAMQKDFMLSSTHPDKKNFIVIKSDVVSTAKTTSVLGIGGLTKQSLVNIATGQLLESSHLTSTQSLANIKVNWKMVYARPLLVTNRCTVTADIVEHKPENAIASTAFLDR
jgi:hypothetical protein